MSTFSIVKGPTALVSWNLNSSEVSVRESILQRDGQLVLSEESKVGFILDPAEEDQECRIFIGDIPLSDISPTPGDAAGVRLGGRLLWRDLPYFDSARGQTSITLRERRGSKRNQPWVTLLSTSIYVLPSKLGEERYQRMSEDLRILSHSLLADLYGKSRRSVDVKLARTASRHHSREEELKAIEMTLSRIEGPLRSIAQRPASRVVTSTRNLRYWGTERLPPSAVAASVRRGTSIRGVSRPVHVMSPIKQETFDVAEHRVIKAFLELLVQRCEYCAAAASAHVQAITSEKYLRDIQLGEGPTIYESVDLPRIARLNRAIENARRCGVMTASLQRLPFLIGVPAAFSSVRDGMFQRNEDYRVVFLLIRRFLMNHAMWFEGGDYSSITKLTWRMFEQWTFLRIVDSFRNAGVDLREWTDVIRQSLSSRFILDFDRGLTFEGQIRTGLRLRFRYEPWILGEAAAMQEGESLHRGYSDVAWSPDIVIECLQLQDGNWVSVYAIVLDCKYTPHPNDHHWNAITKYLEIRSTQTGRQVAKQLCLVYPSGSPGIESEDPRVSFTSSAGPSCPPDETVRFRFSVAPNNVTDINEIASKGLEFDLFAEGTLAFLRRSFSASDSRESVEHLR